MEHYLESLAKGLSHRNALSRMDGLVERYIVDSAGATEYLESLSDEAEAMILGAGPHLAASSEVYVRASENEPWWRFRYRTIGRCSHSQESLRDFINHRRVTYAAISDVRRVVTDSPAVDALVRRAREIVHSAPFFCNCCWNDDCVLSIPRRTMVDPISGAPGVMSCDDLPVFLYVDMMGDASTCEMMWMCFRIAEPTDEDFERVLQIQRRVTAVLASASDSAKDSPS
jgi:hypothetical protein